MAGFLVHYVLILTFAKGYNPRSTPGKGTGTHSNDACEYESVDKCISGVRGHRSDDTANKIGKEDYHQNYQRQRVAF